MPRKNLTPPIAWQGEHATTQVLWHGCVASDADSIMRIGIDLERSRWNTDFGRGFYLTTNREQALRWAQSKSYLATEIASDPTPVVARFRVPRIALAQLAGLHFARSGAVEEAYWNFVRHCRRSDRQTGKLYHHENPNASRNGWYDWVSGPVAQWPDFATIRDADQVSFHTDAGVAILNQIIHRSAPGFAIERATP